MRILFLSSIYPQIYAPNRGIYSSLLCQALAARHEVKVIAPRPWVDLLRHPNRGQGETRNGGPPPNGLEVAAPLYYYPPGVLRGLHASCMWASVRGQVRRLKQSFSPDCVVSYWAYPDGAAAVRAARFLGVPALAMVGGSDVLLWARRGRTCRRVVQVLRAAHGVVAVGPDLKAKVAELGIAPEKIFVVPRGVNTDVFRPGDSQEARRRLGIPPEHRMVLWVGRLVPVKGLDILLEACSLSRARGIDYHLYLIGDGPLKGPLQEEVRARGLGPMVSWAGVVDHPSLPDWYRAADLTVLPSRSEGVPNVLRESLACGTPFVASRVGDIPHLAGQGMGRLVEPGDPVALAEALEIALREGKPAGQPGVSSLSWAESAESFGRVLEAVIEARGQDRGQPADTVSLPAALPGLKTPAPFWRRWVRRFMMALLPRKLLLVRGPARGRSVCLTFDDGPNPQHTPQLLGVLRKLQVPATFFVIGEHAERYPDLVRRIAAEGHEVGHHSFFHTDPRRTPARQLVDEIRRTRDLLAKLVGRPPVLVRPPYGRLSPGKLWGLWREKLTIVLWSVDPKDFAIRSSEELCQWFQRHPLQAGDLVLLHDNHPHAARSLAGVVESARDRGLTFSTPLSWAR